MTDEERVRGLLAQVFELDPPRRPQSVTVRAAYRRRRFAGSAGVATVVTAVVAAVVAGPGLGRSPSAAQAGPSALPVPSATPARSPAAAITLPVVSGSATDPARLAPGNGPLTVLTDGDTVAASGRVVSVPGKPVRLCAPEVNELVAWAPGKEPPPAWCRLGVDVTGVDLSTLATRREKAGAIEGYAYLRGTFHGGSVAITLQATPRYDAGGVPDLTRPPCPAPAGGWSKVIRQGNPGAAERTLQDYTSAHPGEVVSTAVFRPTPTSAVLVIAAEHPDQVRKALPAEPASFCVIQSRYSRAEITSARAVWEAEMSGRLDSSTGVVDGIGQRVGQDGQVTLDTTVVMVTYMVRTWLAAAPAGLVVVHPWLRQVSANAPLPPAAPSGQPDASAIVTEAAASTR